ncbi:hypothetical protein, partial [Microcoleus sp. D2_18a_D3]|uniref:hypothetical protein n=1 Tax=Microcoleus sp. D2_18a_D3 TaxID=3055330 RepID=UPI002FD142EF
IPQEKITLVGWAGEPVLIIFARGLLLWGVGLGVPPALKIHAFRLMGPSQKKSKSSHYYAAPINQPIRYSNRQDVRTLLMAETIDFIASSFFLLPSSFCYIFHSTKTNRPGSIENPLPQKLGRGNGE